MWWRCGGSQNGRWKRFGEHRCELLLEIIQNLRPHSSERERAHLADDLGGARDQDMGAQENCRLRTMNVICGLMPSSVQASACLSNVELGMKVTKRTLKER